jgi:hypothetical protein
MTTNLPLIDKKYKLDPYCRLIELGYDSVTEKEDRRTNFVLEAKKEGNDKNISFQIISPKLLDSITIGSTDKLTGSEARSFNALEKKIVMAIEYNRKRNTLLANWHFFYDHCYRPGNYSHF